VVSHRSRHGGDPNNAVDDADGPAVRPDIDELCRVFEVSRDVVTVL